ncbi:MAG: T3SS effector HopA1 family protein [Actinomycetota bacterium]|nr:T3SS effector HopA1 family protein [Actinomycetota bacterium]
MTGDTARAYLVYNLQAQLYGDFYCAGGARPALHTTATDELPGPSPFVHALSAANAGTGAREPGWTLVHEEDGALVVARGGLSLWMAPAEVYPSNGATLAPGAPVGVLMPKELLRLSPGFYMALGDAELPVDGSEPMVRVYWNLRSYGAAALIDALTRRLNADGIAYRLKVVIDPGRYTRCDAGVLYVLRSQYEGAQDVVSEVYPAVAATLKPSTPALTKQLAPGLGVAEDPGGALVSFGMSRCHLLAEAIAQAAERGVRDPGQRWHLAQQVFAEAGIAIDTPYLNPGSEDRYHRFAP